MKVFWALHKLGYRATGGRLGGRISGRDVLLLTTKGRKSGKSHTSLLFYWRDGDNLVVVPSNGGLDRDPAWWLNLQSNPRTKVEYRGGRGVFAAEKAGPEDRARLWSRITEDEPVYAGYQALTEREIPVVVLRRVSRGSNPARA